LFNNLDENGWKKPKCWICNDDKFIMMERLPMQYEKVTDKNNYTVYAVPCECNLKLQKQHWQTFLESGKYRLIAGYERLKSKQPNFKEWNDQF